MSEDLAHFIIAPDPTWGRWTRWWKWTRLGREVTKMGADAYYITIVVKAKDNYTDGGAA